MNEDTIAVAPTPAPAVPWWLEHYETELAKLKPCCREESNVTHGYIFKGLRSVQFCAVCHRIYNLIDPVTARLIRKRLK